MTADPAYKLSEYEDVSRRLFLADPTRTMTLRNAFTANMNSRFVRLKQVVRKAIAEEDCFGILPSSYADDLNTPGRSAFSFPRSADKVAAFMAWLKRQEQLGLLEIVPYSQIGQAIEPAWTDRYIRAAYERGVGRSRTEMRRAGLAIPSIEVAGGIAAVMMAPMHVDRVGILFTRAFSNLKGITSAMDMQISQILGQGLISGDNPIKLARKLVAVIDGSNAGTLAITDSLGRFIPAQRRARMLARTEIIRAHAQGTLQEYRNWGVEGVLVVAEWVTAGYNVCPICASMQGRTFTIDEAMDRIPAHPNCRCAWIPIVVGDKQ